MYINDSNYGNSKLDFLCSLKDELKDLLYFDDEFKNYMSYDAFIAFNVAYAKISYGKGMLTDEMIYSLLERYKEFLN